MVRKPDPERRISLLSAALTLFVAQGVQNTSTAEISKAAGVAAGTLFLYFPSKQDLINELVIKISREQSDWIKSLLLPSQTAQESFWTIWEGSLRWFIEHPEAYHYVQQIRDSGIVTEAVVCQTEQYLAYYFEAIQKGLAEGCIKPYPVEMIGTILYQDIVAVMNLLTRQTDPAQRENTIRAGFEIFWNGIQVGKELR